MRLLSIAGVPLVVIAAGFMLAALQTGPWWAARPRTASALIRLARVAMVLALVCASVVVLVLRATGQH